MTLLDSQPGAAAPQAPRPSRRWGRWAVRAASGVVLLLAAGALFLQSAAFQQMVRARLIAALEQATGTRAELREFSLDWPRLRVTLRGLVLHGREPADAPPLFSASWIEARWRLLSFWSLAADLAAVRVFEPRLYLTFAEDGRSNLPRLPRAAGAGGRWVEQMLALRIGQLELLRGELRWNQQALPLEFRAGQIRLRLDYEPAEDRYAGQFDFRDAALVGRGAPLESRGNLRFRLYADRAEIESFEWQGNGSRLALRGAVRNFRQPRVEFRYDAAIDLGGGGAALGFSGWNGTVAGTGNGAFSAAGWELSGDLAVRIRRNGIPGWREVPWSARGRLRVASLDAELAAGDSALPAWEATLDDLVVSTLGGELSGSATVRDSDRGPETTLKLVARRLSFSAMTTAGIALPVPLDRLRWMGAVSGPLQTSFVGMGRDLIVATDWQVEAPLSAPPGFTPISGRLRGRYDAARHRLESAASYVDLPRTHLSGDGWFDERDSEMRLALRTTSYEENRALAALLSPRFAELPVALRGSAAAQMTWTGGTRRARLQGQFRVGEFAYQDTRWDSFAGRLEYQQDSGLASDRAAPQAERAAASAVASLAIRSGELRRDSAAIQFDLAMELEDGGFQEHNRFHLRANLRDAPAEDLLRLAGRSDPVRGTVEASLEASGTRRQPAGSGILLLSNGALYDEPFDRLTARLRLDPGGLWTADRLRLEKQQGEVAGSASYDPERRQFRFDLTGRRIALASVRWLRQERMPLTGTAELALAGQGTLERPQLRGEIRVQDLGLGEAGSGSAAARIETRDGRAHWSVAGELLDGQLRADGDTLLSGEFPWSAEIAFQKFDLPTLIRMFRIPPEGLSGTVEGILRAHGAMRNLATVEVSGEIRGLQGSLRGVSVRNIGPAPFHYRDKTIRLERLRLEGPRAEVETAGTVRVGENPALELRTTGYMDLAALRAADSAFVPAGRVRLDAQIGGTVQRPLWRGRLYLDDTSLFYDNLPNGLEHINGSVVFEGTRGVLENVTAESGGGRIQLSGFVRSGEDGGLQFHIVGDATQVRVRYPAGLSTWINGRLTWAGTLENSMIEGRVVLTRQAVSPQFDLVQSLLRREEGVNGEALPEVLRNMRLNVEVVSAADLRLDTLTTRNLQTDVELRIQGTVAQPAWLGRIGILEGEILFAGKRYSVNRGEISFVNPFRFEPVLSLSVQARVQRYDISMDFSGPADRLTVTYRSDPPLPTRDILALLVAGSPRETSLTTTANQPLPEVGADALLSQALQSQIGTRLDRLFGSGRIRVDPRISGIGRSANASVALEQQISDALSVLYITDVTSTQQQTIQAEWNISPRLSVVGIRDQNGLIGVNFQITLRFR